MCPRQRKQVHTASRLSSLTNTEDQHRSPILAPDSAQISNSQRTPTIPHEVHQYHLTTQTAAKPHNTNPFSKTAIPIDEQATATTPIAMVLSHHLHISNTSRLRLVSTVDSIISLLPLRTAHNRSNTLQDRICQQGGNRLLPRLALLRSKTTVLYKQRHTRVGLAGMPAILIGVRLRVVVILGLG